jgi:hypothetical protein
MARNGSGTYVRTDGVRTGSTVFAQQQSAGVNIEATLLDVEAQDMADALTQSLSKDGQTVPTANLPMGGFKLTGLANGSALTDSVAYGQVANLAMGLEWKNGLLVSNNVSDATNDIDVAAGQIMDYTNTYRMNCQAMTKRIDAAFSVGTGNGGLASADSLSNDTWYGVFEIHKSATSSTAANSDVVFATTRARALASTGVTGVFDICRLVGYVRRGTATNLAFVNSRNGTSWWDVPISNVTAESTAGATSTVTTPPSQVGILGYFIAIEDSDTSVAGFGSIRQVGQTIAAPTAINCDAACEVTVIGSSSNPTSTTAKTTVYVKADTSSQIQHRESSAVISIDISAKGWVMDYSVTDLV